MPKHGKLMARLEKRMSDVTPNDWTSEVAGHTLQFRLAAVRHYLSPAANMHNEGSKHVHDLRVAARRAAAALQLYADMLPHRRTARLEKRLNKIRRAAGDARDYDVLAQRLSVGHSDTEAQRLLKKVRARRRKAQRPIQTIFRHLKKHDRFDRSVKKLLRGVRPRRKTKAESKDVRFGEWARTHLRRIVNWFFKLAPTDEMDATSLHRFRIRAKDLRYEMELLAGAFPPDFIEELYPLAKTLQQQLGEINDHVCIQARLRQLLGKAEDHAEACHVRALLGDERARLNQSRQTLLQWWTRQRKDDLWARFKELLAS